MVNGMVPLDPRRLGDAIPFKRFFAKVHDESWYMFCSHWKMSGHGGWNTYLEEQVVPHSYASEQLMGNFVRRLVAIATELAHVLGNHHAR